MFQDEGCFQSFNLRYFDRNLTVDAAHCSPLWVQIWFNLNNSLILYEIFIEFQHSGCSWMTHNLQQWRRDEIDQPVKGEETRSRRLEGCSSAKLQLCHWNINKRVDCRLPVKGFTFKALNVHLLHRFSIEMSNGKFHWRIQNVSGAIHSFVTWM